MSKVVPVIGKKRTTLQRQSLPVRKLRQSQIKPKKTETFPDRWTKYKNLEVYRETSPVEFERGDPIGPGLIDCCEKYEFRPKVNLVPCEETNQCAEPYTEIRNGKSVTVFKFLLTEECYEKHLFNLMVPHQIKKHVKCQPSDKWAKWFEENKDGVTTVTYMREMWQHEIPEMSQAYRQYRKNAFREEWYG